VVSANREHVGVGSKDRTWLDLGMGERFRSRSVQFTRGRNWKHDGCQPVPDGRSKFGCYDMAGNVWELVDSESVDSWECVLRGGSYLNDERQVRSYLRLERVPRNHRPPDFGFRVAQRQV
jgi:formylglycine-generating enzyme required for sulfatase activity